MQIFLQMRRVKEGSFFGMYGEFYGCIEDNGTVLLLTFGPAGAADGPLAGPLLDLLFDFICARLEEL